MTNADLKNFTPRNGWILLQQLPPKQVTSGGLIAPEPIQSDYYRILAVADDCEGTWATGSAVIAAPGMGIVGVQGCDPAAFFIKEEGIVAIVDEAEPGRIITP